MGLHMQPVACSLVEFTIHRNITVPIMKQQVTHGNGTVLHMNIIVIVKLPCHIVKIQHRIPKIEGDIVHIGKIDAAGQPRNTALLLVKLIEPLKLVLYGVIQGGRLQVHIGERHTRFTQHSQDRIRFQHEVKTLGSGRISIQDKVMHGKLVPDSKERHIRLNLVCTMVGSDG